MKRMRALEARTVATADSVQLESERIVCLDAEGNEVASFSLDEVDAFADDPDIMGLMVEDVGEWIVHPALRHQPRR
jgi:hypothetical protein